MSVSHKRLATLAAVAQPLPFAMPPIKPKGLSKIESCEPSSRGTPFALSTISAASGTRNAAAFLLQFR